MAGGDDESTRSDSGVVEGQGKSRDRRRPMDIAQDAVPARSVGLSVAHLLFGMLSPTWAFARWRKNRREREGKAATIAFLNRTYLAIAVVTVVITITVTGNSLSRLQLPGWLLPFGLWGYYLWAWFLSSRCVEVFYAFYRDAFAKLAPVDSSSGLTWPLRVRLALNSYAELVFDFALLYGLMPSSVWAQKSAPSFVTDVIFYSASTITTSGQGGFGSNHFVLQMLTCFEIVAGLILLVVCFAIYAGRAMGGRPVLVEIPFGNTDSSAVTSDDGTVMDSRPKT